ncbi:MAG TPA: hypothetical protein VFI47_25010 [Acidimicrobiales bacterium]|nr:hypothetical protein [Acidimicrobiales bacterium]
METPRPRARLGALMAAAGVMLASLVLSPSPGGAQSNPLQRGPAPTQASVEAARGPFAFSSVTVPRGNGFGGGTIYYPNDTSQGTFGVVAVSPGFTEGQNAISWTGPRLASQGFVVITIATLNVFEGPSARADELTSALEWASTAGPAAARQRMDPSRFAVMGHSMGGGATLETVRDNPDYQAGVALQPWDLGQNFGSVQVPTLIVGAQNDVIATVGAHARPFYNQIPATAEKAYLELAGAGHFVGTSPGTNVHQARTAISWLKRYVDNDTRYEQFLCPPPSGTGISQYQHTCPG